MMAMTTKGENDNGNKNIQATAQSTMNNQCYFCPKQQQYAMIHDYLLVGLSTGRMTSFALYQVPGTVLYNKKRCTARIFGSLVGSVHSNTNTMGRSIWLQIPSYTPLCSIKKIKK